MQKKADRPVPPPHDKRPVVLSTNTTYEVQVWSSVGRSDYGWMVWRATPLYSTAQATVKELLRGDYRKRDVRVVSLTSSIVAEVL